MRDLLSWNINLGRWAGVQIRLHALFLVMALLALVAAGREQKSDGLAHYGVFFAVLLVSVSLHELAHAVMARRLGGKLDQIVLWPLGGLTRPKFVNAPLRDAAVAVAGPAVNLLLALGAGLALWFDGHDALEAAHPLRFQVGVMTMAGAVRLMLWVNLWILAAINLLPALPLDGGVAVRALLTHALGAPRAAQAAVRVAQVTGFGLCLMGWWVPSTPENELLWLPLVLLGIFLFCSASLSETRTLRMPGTEMAGYDLSRGNPTLSDTSARDIGAREHGSFELEMDAEEPQVRVTSSAEVREIHREEQRQHQLKLEADEDRRVDEILARLHTSGLDGLSPEDRALLDRVSARYRSRQRQSHD